MLKKRLLNVVLIVVLVLLVPFLIGRITAAILEATYPAASSPATANRNIRATTFKERLDQIQRESEAAKNSLERARAMTRMTLVVIGVYYVVLILSWIILWRRKRKLSPAA